MRQKTIRRLALCGAFLLTLLACTEKPSKHEKAMRTDSMGAQSELALVIDDALMNTDVVDTLDAILLGDAPGLTQKETMFQVIHLAAKYYNHKYATMHTIVFVKLDPKCKQPSISAGYNVDAHPQIVVKLTAPTADAMREFLPKEKEHLCDLILDHQLQVKADYLKKHYSKMVYDDLMPYGYTVDVPAEIAFTKKGKDFLWGSARTDEKDYNFVFYTYPFTGHWDTSDHAFAMKRDSVMQVNIPGADSTQWMKTVWEQDEPIIYNRLRTIDGQTVEEVRGLWEMHNGAMGGPFVSLVHVDTADAKVVVAEGFIFSPSTSKRDLVRTMEASLRTLTKTK